MEVPARHRPLVVLVAVVLAQVLLLAFQIKRGQDVRLIRLWSVELLTPIERAATFTFSEISGAWHGYIDLRHAHSENQKLEAKVGRLELKNQRLEGQAAEGVRLSRLLGFRQTNAEARMVAAEVFGASADPNSHTIFINRGEDDGIRNGRPVITPDGIVGRTIEVFPHTAQVLLITDKESGVGALLASTRTHGVVKGTGDPTLRMDYVVAGEKVSPGDRVLTSGDDRIFPKDLPVGTVISVRHGTLFQEIRLQPAAHLDRLEEVLVLLSERPIKVPETDAARHAGPSPPREAEKSMEAETRRAPPPKSSTGQDQASQPLSGTHVSGVPASPGPQKTPAAKKGGKNTMKTAATNPPVSKSRAAAHPAVLNETQENPAIPAPAAKTSTAKPAAAIPPARNASGAKATPPKPTAQTKKPSDGSKKPGGGNSPGKPD